MANGSPIAGVIDAEVIANNHFAADRFHARIALGTDPLHTAAFWSAARDIQIDVRLGLGGIGFQSLLVGAVDSIVLDPVSGTVALAGRDLAAGLIDTRSQDAFANRTSSEIVTLLAQRHGLTPEVTPTTTLVGRYYESEHDRITLGLFSRAISEWDQLMFLARQEGFDLFVQGKTLYFQSAQQNSAPIVVQPTDLSALHLHRSLTLARDIEVTVKSWNSHQKSAFVQTAKASGLASTSGGGFGTQAPQKYTLVRPNLTPDQALRLAQRKLAELSQHERVFEATLPGELAMTPRSQIILVGTGTDFDQTYFVDSIERSLSPQHGFTQRIRAKNTSPRSEATIPGDDAGTGTGA